MLFGRHLVYKVNFEKNLAQVDAKAIELNNLVNDLKRRAAPLMKVRAVWQFFEAERAGNSIDLFAPGGADPIHTFHFGRQPRPNGLCLSDYILPARNGQRDHLALFVVTAGAGVREVAQELKELPEYFMTHATQT